MDTEVEFENQPRTTVRGAFGSLLSSLWELGSSVVDYGKQQLVQLGNGIEEEIKRATQILLLSVLVSILVGVGLLMTGLTVVIAFWDSPHRLLVAILVTVSLFLIAGIGALVVRRKMRRGPSLIGGTAQAALLYSAYRKIIG